MKINLAGCVIENHEGKILLLHRNTSKRVQWETPGGKVEKDEDPENAAVREAEEELGIKVDIVKKLGEETFREDDFEMNYVWFKAKITGGNPKPVEDGFDKLEYFSWEELKDKDDLSANTQNLVSAYYNKKIAL